MCAEPWVQSPAPHEPSIVAHFYSVGTCGRRQKHPESSGVQAVLSCIVRLSPASEHKTPKLAWLLAPGSWRWTLFVFLFSLGVWGCEGHAVAFMQKSEAGYGVPSSLSTAWVLRVKLGSSGLCRPLPSCYPSLSLPGSTTESHPGPKR